MRTYYPITILLISLILLFINKYECDEVKQMNFILHLEGTMPFILSDLEERTDAIAIAIHDGIYLYAGVER
jgi:hypothetical protein